jgi:bifunctional non-homologous end joining protein LigD
MAQADSLAEYRRKRDFAKTAEPAGKVARRGGASFVVQKHDATRLHYDFRLELDGVLKSWAVTRGPSLDPAEKRLAVQVEDHPLEYGGFEGTIPEGEYGGGTVMLWDRGTWEPLNDPHEGLKQGMLHFRLHGERMKGGWALVRMPPRGREKRENWLLIKERDEAADDVDPLLKDNVTSVVTGRTMEEIAAGDSAVWHSNRPGRGGAEARARGRRNAAARLALPKFQPPQLASPVDAPPEGDEWVHEFKYDGYRLLIAANGSEVRCYTRSGQDWTDKFRAIADAVRAMDMAGALIDGEVVAFAKGRADFSTLQRALGEGGRLDFFAFDLLEEGGEDLAMKPLLERKRRLQALLADLPAESPIHYSDHIQGQGGRVLAKICEAGHEGIVSKKANAPYRGERTKTWLKVKCKRRQEFVIGGWTPSDKRTGFKSLLVGAFEGGKLVYAGRVGTGFDESALEDLSRRLAALARKDSPFVEVPSEVRRSKWVEPKLVAEIEFAEFTADGILRHPSFLGLREDKPAAEVGLERPQPVGNVATSGKDDEITRAGIRVTSPGKVLFAGQGLTKTDLIDYYEAVAPLMLPHLKDRPLTLVRCPRGRGGRCFFQKHDSGGFPAAMRRVMIDDSSGKSEQYFYIDDLQGIVAGVQMGVLEFHIWGSRRDEVEKPDRIVFDLDPDVDLDFEDVRRAAFDLRDRLEDIGLKTFPMLSGGKGFHVIAPLTRRAEWREVKAFCQGFALKLGEEAPDRYVANMAKARRKGRIFVDYLRNERGATAICPYSTRARENAPVAAPVSWKEAETIAAANLFTARIMRERASKVGDPWADYFDTRQSLTKAMMRAVGAG